MTQISAPIFPSVSHISMKLLPPTVRPFGEGKKSSVWAASDIRNKYSNSHEQNQFPLRPSEVPRNSNEYWLTLSSKHFFSSTLPFISDGKTLFLSLVNPHDVNFECQTVLPSAPSHHFPLFISNPFVWRILISLFLIPHHHLAFASTFFLSLAFHSLSIVSDKYSKGKGKSFVWNWNFRY